MLTRLDTTASDFQERLEELRKKLSPDGTVVSERSTKLTMSLFGQALSPQEVVERICQDVQKGKTQAVLKYARVLDDPNIVAERLRVPRDRMAAAHGSVWERFVAQAAIYTLGTYWDLRAWRGCCLSIDGPHDGRSGVGRRCSGDSGHGPPYPVWSLQS